MKRKNLFGGGISFLIVAILAVVAFIRGPEQVWFLAGIFIIWGVYMIAAVLLLNKDRIKTKLNQRRLRKLRAQENRRAENYKAKEFHGPEVDDATVGAVLLRHVNHRISAYLKSAYPSVTWEWVSADPEQLVAKGGTGRIQLYGVTDFNHAEIIFDQLARIDCEMMRIVPLAELDKADDEPAREHTGQPVDPEVWYSIQGKAVLEACIGDLNSRGHASLMIRENGEISIQQADADVVHDKLKNLPAKSYWERIVNLLEKEGLAASVMEDGIKVSW